MPGESSKDLEDVSISKEIRNVKSLYKWLENKKKNGVYDNDVIKEAQRLSKMLETAKSGQIYTLNGSCSITGKETVLQVPNFDSQTDKLIVKLDSYVELSTKFNKVGNTSFKNKQDDSILRIAKWPKYEHEKLEHGTPRTDQGPWDTWKSQWNTENSIENKEFYKFRQQIRGVIMSFADRLLSVENIVCFALGPLNASTILDRGFPKNYLQHLLAVEIQQTLEEMHEEHDKSLTALASKIVAAPKAIQPSASSTFSIKKSGTQTASISGRRRQKIPILAQDPYYCENCVSVLKNTLGIEAVTDFRGFTSLTENTLVINIAPSQCLDQVVSDILVDVGGPVAMLCDPIFRAEKSWNSTIIMDPHLQWDGYDGTSDTEQNERLLETQPTLNMLNYAAECDSAYFGDYKEKAGITWRKRNTKFRHLPVVAKVRKLNVKKDKNKLDRLYELCELSFQPDVEEETKFERLKNRLRKIKGGTDYFRDLEFYVKKKEISVASYAAASASESKRSEGTNENWGENADVYNVSMPNEQESLAYEGNGKRKQ